MGVFNYFCPKCGSTKLVEHKVAASPYVRCNDCTSMMERAIKVKPNDRNKETRQTRNNS